jgi:thiamine kinase-like enzyme
MDHGRLWFKEMAIEEMSPALIERVRALPVWKGLISPTLLTGGITNLNILVSDRGDEYVVRIADDIPVLHVMRFNELAASRAAAEVGVSPEIVHAEPGVMVRRYVRGRVLQTQDLQDPKMVERVVDLLKRVHGPVGRAVRGPILAFSPFHTIRDHAATVAADGGTGSKSLPGMLAAADVLSRIVGRVSVIFGHNDMLPANLIDDGSRLWLIDWDYAGFGPASFDLANLAANCRTDSAMERQLLTLYYGKQPDDVEFRRFVAMKCVSLLRETLWGMVAETRLPLDTDYAAYTAKNLARFRSEYNRFHSMTG